jgi:multidrug transporter EmrE-like cation transporter
MKALLVVLVVLVFMVVSDFRAIDAKNMEIRLAIAYERMAQISANIQNGKIVWSVSDARPNSFHIPSSRNMVRGRE